MTGAQRRSAPFALSAMPTTTRAVARAQTGAAKGGAAAGTCISMSKTIGITVTAISMMTVPATVGVRIRRRRESRAESANWKNEEMTTRVASMAGPPSAIAATQTAMNAPEVPIMSTYPAPTRPTRTAWSTVVTPLTATAANTAQDRNTSSPPAARITMTGVNTTPAMVRTASWSPSPKASAFEGLSSGW